MGNSHTYSIVTSKYFFLYSRRYEKWKIIILIYSTQGLAEKIIQKPPAGPSMIYSQQNLVYIYTPRSYGIQQSVGLIYDIPSSEIRSPYVDPVTLQ